MEAPRSALGPGERARAAIVRARLRSHGIWALISCSVPPAEAVCRDPRRRALDRVRQFVARALGEVDEEATALLWVTDFPMFEWCAPENQP